MKPNNTPSNEEDLLRVILKINNRENLIYDFKKKIDKNDNEKNEK